LFNQYNMDCFFPLNSCGSNSNHGRSSSTGRAPRSRKEDKASTRSGRRQSREPRPRDDRRGRSRSKSVEALSGPKGGPKKESPRTPQKRVGAAYRRTDDSIITSNDAATLLTDRGLDVSDESEGTATMGSGSGSCCSGDDEDVPYPIEQSMSAPESSVNPNNEVVSVANTDNVQDKTSPYSWFQPTLNKRANLRTSAADLSSPSNSVGAVKSTFKNKFDYIRKTQQFANPNFQDPPSDRSLATSFSVNAAEAGSILTKGFRNRRSDLARQIIKRRQVIVSRTGFDP
jgi:hypothetical protein